MYFLKYVFWTIFSPEKATDCSFKMKGIQIKQKRTKSNESEHNQFTQNQTGGGESNTI